MSLKKRFVREPWPEADSYEEAFAIQWDLINPFDWHLHAFAEDPKIETAIQVMYKPTIGYAGYWWTSRLAGVTMPSFWARLGGSAVDMAKAGQALAPYLPALLLGMVYGVVGYQVVAAPYRTISSLSAGSMTTHLGGGMSFRNPISGI